MSDIFNIIGLGQAGARIGREFNKIGFDVCYINSDVVDMRDLNVLKENILILEGTGSGRSPAIAKKILERNYDKFAEFLDDHLSDTLINVFIIGLGGGTGGGMIIPAIEYVKEKGLKVGLIATLPPKLAGMMDMENAMHGLKELKDIDMNLFILIDNELLLERIGLSADWWHKINYYILTKILSAFDLLRENKTSQTGIGSIDKAEIRRILQYGKGLMDIRDIYLTIPDETNLSDEDLKKKIFDSALISGYNYRDTLFYLISVDVPKEGGYTELASRIFSITKSTFGSALARIGMSNDPVLRKAIRITLITTGLKLPKVLRSKINNLKRDADRHEQKREKKDLMDFGTIDNINLNDDFEI
jgi:cell division GTPase FtsZ